MDMGGGVGLLTDETVVIPGTENAGPSSEPAKPPDYLLLRFLDFDVKPNKQYQYRVFLVLCNPNYQLEPGVLEEPELAESQWIGLKTPGPKTNDKGEVVDWPTNPKYAKWSPPCTAGRLPGDLLLLGGPVVSVRVPEINAEVRLLLWLEQSGLNGNFSADHQIRGTILNFPGVSVKTPGGARTKADLAPNCILVDLQGGESLPGDKERSLKVPGLILVMDEAGNLVMHDEVAEAEAWEKAQKQTEKRDAQPSGRPSDERRTGRPREGGVETRPDIDSVPTRRGS